ncbi:MAG: methionyl-tRNA formyltransferase [Chitinophagales bacterium]|nr:methionyl-tRNA formyltransferase [Chitinophagales bacterium]MCZ2394724.1 methionyl-tRNA formyltransferase [Chitinophagales bacterium]
MSIKLKIVFMGTPAFAVESLDILVKNGYEIAAIVTSPDKPSGRGQKMNISSVKQYALEHHLPILQPIKLKDEKFLQELKDINANLFIVVAFRMLPEVVWSMPELGTFNLHASLLPQYRGAAPINWAIINGETKTGVTTFFLQHEIDTGDILLNKTIDILPEDDAGSLHDKLMHLGAELTLKTVKAIASNQIKANPQPNAPSIHAPKIFKEDGLLNFNNPTIQVHNKIRGLSPYPGAYMYLNQKILKIFKSKIEIDINNITTGTIDTDQKSYFKIRCQDGWLHILSLQIEGKKKMDIQDFLKGYRE